MKSLLVCLCLEPNNEHLAVPGPTLLEKAKEFLANNGSLSEASLMLEAAIQKGELGEGGYEAWILLGEARSMDEREDLGLLALRQGVQIAKGAGLVGPGMLVCIKSSRSLSFRNILLLPKLLITLVFPVPRSILHERSIRARSDKRPPRMASRQVPHWWCPTV